MSCKQRFFVIHIFIHTVCWRRYNDTSSACHCVAWHWAQPCAHAKQQLSWQQSHSCQYSFSCLHIIHLKHNQLTQPWTMHILNCNQLQGAATTVSSALTSSALTAPVSTWGHALTLQQTDELKCLFDSLWIIFVDRPQDTPPRKNTRRWRRWTRGANVQNVRPAANIPHAV